MRTKTLILWLLLFVTIPSFAYDFQSGDLFYKITSDSTVEVTSGDYSELTSVIIPETVTYNGKTYSVTSIGESAFFGCTDLTFIIIPDGVTQICETAFHGCTSLTSITIPDNVTIIGEGAFVGCTSLTSVTWNAKNCYLRGSHYPYIFIFDIDKGITSLVFGNGVETIPDCLCYGCTNLTSITIPNGITSIGNFAFYNCTGLTSITIPNSVTSIGEDAFKGTPWYENQPNGVLYIGSVLYEYKNKSDMPQGTNIVVKDGITTINTKAFYNCTGLTSVTIPDGVTTIGEKAFYDCTGLTSVIIPNSVTTIGFGAFRNVRNIVYYGRAIGEPWGAKNQNGYIDGYLLYADASKTTLLYCNRAVTEEIIIPSGVTTIGGAAFFGCTGLTSITIPNSVTTIEHYAFTGCSGLTSVIWNAKECGNWSSAAEAPFTGTAESIASFTFGDEVNHIPSYLCYSMKNLTSITFPSRVTSIGSAAFAGCTGLTSVTIPNNVTSIGDAAFSGCSGLTSVIWNAKNCQGWSQYNDSPFYAENGESSITSFIFGNNVKSIPSYLCYGMNELTSITIPHSVTSIGNSALYGCSNLTSITIPNSVTIIGASAFSACVGLSSVTIPNSVQTIGKNAFENCKYLEEVSFGTDIDEIGENAFAGDSRIYSVTCYADITPTIYESTFSGVSSNAELHVLANLVKKYKVNEYWGRFTIVPIGADNTTDGTLSVTPSETDATFTWPTNDNADTYTLTIQKGDMVFCTLTFDANGVLQSMRFAAPSRSVAQHTAQAQATGNGFRFVVEGLDRATTYAYSITAKDKDETVLSNYSGTFTTQAPTGIEDILSTPSQPTTHKVFRNGQVYILRDDKMYNINGTEM